MSKDRSEEIQDHHNQGQEDGSKGDYDKPHSITIIDEMIYSEKLVSEMREDNDAYRAGYENGRKQR